MGEPPKELKKLGIQAPADIIYFLLILVISVVVFYTAFFPLPNISMILGEIVVDITIISYLVAFFSIFISLGWTAGLVVGLICTFYYRNEKPKECTINPLVSVIIPARNEENVIAEILTNLQKQTYKNLEIIPVCHNCTDRTYEIAMSFAAKDERIKPLEVNEDKYGKPYSLNHGLEIAHGELVTIFDSDSKFDDNFIEQSVSYFQDEDVDAIQPRIVSSNHNSYLLSFFTDLEFITYTDLLLLTRRFIRANAILGGTGSTIRREVLEKMGGWEICLVEDFALSLKLNSQGYKIKFAYPIHLYDERVPYWSGFIRQRSRWMRGNWQMVKKYFIKSMPRPSDFFLIINCIWIFATYYSFAILLVNVLGGEIVGFYTPFYVWFSLYVTQMSCMIIRIVSVRKLKGLLYFPAYILYLYHWIPIFYYAMKLKHGWKNTKTRHGFR